MTHQNHARKTISTEGQCHRFQRHMDVGDTIQHRTSPNFQMKMEGGNGEKPPRASVEWVLPQPLTSAPSSWAATCLPLSPPSANQPHPEPPLFPKAKGVSLPSRPLPRPALLHPNKPNSSDTPSPDPGPSTHLAPPHTHLGSSLHAHRQVSSPQLGWDSCPGPAAPTPTSRGKQTWSMLLG